MLSRDRGTHRAQDQGQLVNSWAGDLSSGARGLARRSRFHILFLAPLKVSLLSGMCTSLSLASSTPATSRWCPAQQKHVGRCGVHRRIREFATPQEIHHAQCASDRSGSLLTICWTSWRPLCARRASTSTRYSKIRFPSARSSSMTHAGDVLCGIASPRNLMAGGRFRSNGGTSTRR